MDLINFMPRNVAEHGAPYEELYIAPIGDIQYGSPTFADRAFKEHLEWIEDRSEGRALFLGMGDYIDFMSPSNRSRVAQARLYDTTTGTLDDAARNHTNKVADLLSHTRGRWLGLLSGHHYWEYSTGGSTDTQLAETLEAPYIEVCGDIELRFRRSGSSQTRGKVRIWAHHGVGGGASSLNKLNKIWPHFPDKDVFLIGHFHECTHIFKQRIIRSGKRNLSMPALLACTGAWLKGYVPNTDTYVERGMMPPRALGGMLIKVTPRQQYGLWSPRIEVISSGV